MPSRFGGLPPSWFSSGTVSQSAMTSNIETEILAPCPVTPRRISASRMAECAVAPVAMSTMEMPTRAGSDGPPVIEHSPDSAWISRS